MAYKGGELFYKQAIEYIPLHIVITDVDGVILFANSQAEKTTGYKKEEMIGKKPSLWGKQMDSDFYVKMWQTIKEERRMFEGIIKNRRKNGEIYFCVARVAPIVKDGILVGFAGIEFDLSGIHKTGAKIGLDDDQIAMIEKSLTLDFEV